MEMEYSEVTIDVSRYPDRNIFRDPGPIWVSGIRVTVRVKYSGDYKLWSLRPNPWRRVFPRSYVGHLGKDGFGFLEMTVEQPTDEPQERIKQRIEGTLESIRFFIEAQRKQIESHNRGIRDLIHQALQARRNRIKEHDQIVDVLKIPLKRKEGVPIIKSLPLKRKLVRPLPPPPNSGFKAEPGITPEDYDHILSVIRHEGRTFEFTPKTFAVHDEEELRDILLAHLNGHYHGDATGETFRQSGKTDIRIETDNRAAFIGECKVWRGQKELTKAIDQLLSYLTWRDCKASLIIFNKNVSGFSDLLLKVPEALRTHSNFRGVLGSPEAGEWRFEFASMEDELRRVIVHVFLFNLYVNK